MGGSVSITVKFAFALAGCGSNEGVTSKEIAMIPMATRTAADPYLKVHFPDKVFLLRSLATYKEI